MLPLLLLYAAPSLLCTRMKAPRPSLLFQLSPGHACGLLTYSHPGLAPPSLQVSFFLLSLVVVLIPPPSVVGTPSRYLARRIRCSRRQTAVPPPAVRPTSTRSWTSWKVSTKKPAFPALSSFYVGKPGRTNPCKSCTLRTTGTRAAQGFDLLYS